MEQVRSDRTSAESLHTNGHSVTVIDTDPQRLRDVEDTMDVATLLGNAADAAILREARADAAEMVVAATDSDEVNLLTASLGKAMGATKSVARVHDVNFYQQEDLDYRTHLGIDQLMCPEFATAMTIARKLRMPSAKAVENFARGQIEMQEFTASENGSAIGKRLLDVRFPPGSRLALIRRKGEAYIPEATSVVSPGDSLILVGNAEVFEDARRLFFAEKGPRKRIVIMGGPTMAVWLCRALNNRSFSIRLFEKDRQRAEELADRLDWVTVISADPTERSVFDEERIGQADVFISMLGSDEANIIAGVLAKTRGVETVVTVVQQSKYLDVIYDIGVDDAYSTRHVAASEIDAELDVRPLRKLGSLAEGSVDVYRVRIGAEAAAVGKALRELQLAPDWVVAGIQRKGDTHVPGADDVIEAHDTVLVVGKQGQENTLKKLLTGR